MVGESKVWILAVSIFIAVLLQYFYKTYRGTGLLKVITIEDFAQRKFPLKGFSDQFISDTEILLQSRADLVIYNLDTRKETILLPNVRCGKYKGAQISLSPDRTKVIIRYDIRRSHRFTSYAKCDVHALEANETYQLRNSERLISCKWNPDGNSITYSYKNNLYYWNPNGEEYALTTEGKEETIFAGTADWIYSEQVFQTSDLYYYSPDGSKLAVIQLNATNVSTFHYQLYKDMESPHDFLTYPKNVSMKLTLPGTPLAKVKLIVKASSGRNLNRWKDFYAPENIVGSEQILFQFSWLDNEDFILVWMNRIQDKLAIQKCNFNGVCRQVIVLEEPNGFHQLDKLKCYIETNSCLFVYWIGDWAQIWELDLKMGVNKMNPVGEFDVMSIYGRHKLTADIFYLASREGHPEQAQVYRNKRCLSCAMKDVDGIQCTNAYAVFSVNLVYFAMICVGPTPGYSKIFKVQDDMELEIMDWHTNENTRKILQQYQLPLIKYDRFPISGGFTGYAKLLFPPNIDLDPIYPFKKYPMIVYVYGGPSYVHVQEHFTIWWETYLVTNRKVVYAFIDGRGAGNKGKEYLFQIKHRLGRVEVDDAMNITRQILHKYPIINKDRVGIWGWSYGGYTTAMAMGRDSEKLFRCGIDVGGVTSWKHYGALYTEKLMDLPQKGAIVPDRYERSDASVNVENFRGRDFLIIHSTGDDNVHFSHALKLATALQNADIQFQMMVYTDESHALSNYVSHVHRTMDRFWVRCLGT